MTHLRSFFLVVAAGVLLGPLPALAQTHGAVTGFVKDSAGLPVAGAVIEASSSSLMGKQTAVTKADGSYRFPLLPIGKYKLISRRDGYRDTEQGGVIIQLDRTLRIDIAMASQEMHGGEVTVTAAAPLVDQTSNTKGIIIGTDLLSNLATGRQLSGILGITPGAHSDATGVNFSGATGLENAWIIDGVNTTGIEKGYSSSDVPTQFIKQVEVKTGGYQAEFGRANGAVINVVSKEGGNEFHGNVWANLENSALRNVPRTVALAGSTVSSQDVLDYKSDFGFGIGGYIVRDRIWFYAGLSPTMQRNTMFQRFFSRVDWNNDGSPDVSSEDSNLDGKPDEIYIQLAERKWNYWSRRVQPIAKLMVNVTENISTQFSYLGSSRKQWGVLSAAALRTGEPEYFTGKLVEESADWSARVTAQLFEKSMIVEAQFGYHREASGTWPTDDRGNKPLYILLSPSRHWEFGDNPGTPFNDVEVPSWRWGGFGFYEDVRSFRGQGYIHLTNFLTFAGRHTIMYGSDVERNDLWSKRGYTGAYYVYGGGTGAPLTLNPIGTTSRWLVGSDPNPRGDGRPDDPLWESRPWSEAKTRNFYHAYFLRDSWNILPNLTANVGMRFERQELRSARNVVKFIVGQFSQFNNGWAPRLGLNYDWTNKGKSKLDVFFGRFYESIPMNINNRAFGAEVIALTAYPFARNAQGFIAGPFSTSGSGGDAALQKESFDYTTGEWSGRVALKGQFHDEFVLGYEHEVLPDLKLGITYERKYIGRCIEDISIDGGQTYIIANPGTGFARFGYINDAYLQQTTKYDFPRPSRDYKALKLTAEKRMSQNWQLVFSYTLARSYGNYPGLFTANNGQDDPNINSIYDLPDIMVNRYGDLDSDVRHSLKLDGSYEYDLGRFGSIVTGPTLRWRTGVPLNALGREGYYGYGPNEVFILPRGSVGRNPSRFQLDAKIRYKYKLAGGRSIGIAAEVFNVFNTRKPVLLSSQYTTNSVTTLPNVYNPNGTNYNNEPWDLDRLIEHTVPDWVQDVNFNGDPSDDCGWGGVPGAMPPVGSSMVCTDPISGDSIDLERYDADTDSGYLSQVGGSSMMYRYKGFKQPTQYQEPRTLRLSIDFEF